MSKMGYLHESRLIRREASISIVRFISFCDRIKNTFDCSKAPTIGLGLTGAIWFVVWTVALTVAAQGMDCKQKFQKLYKRYVTYLIIQ